MTSPNLVPQSYCSYYYINPQGEAPLFLHLPEEAGSKSVPDNLPCAKWWHATFNCVKVLCLLTFFFHADPTHTHTYTHRSWQMEVGGKVVSQGWVVRDFKNRHQNLQWSGHEWFLEWRTRGGWRYRGVGRMQSVAFCWSNFYTHA